ncbi:hypothetical protein GCM10009760_62570 [Kitasatospora kazusensis]|uniref:Uncharacterized protein n=1 Tax=Kitasatospora kazusensis TaxID=407974 RepID=A0ABN1ZL58_9ACTN
MFRRSETKPSTRTETPDHTASNGRVWTGSDYDEARANGHVVYAPHTDHSNNQLGQPTT